MPDQPIRLIVTDIDGTLLDDRGKLPQENIRAIRKARERGIVVAICTGRFPENAYLLLEDYNLRCPIIGANGGRTVDEDLRTLTEHTMDPSAAAQVLDTVLTFGAQCFIFGRRFVCTCKEGGHHHSELSHGDRIRALGFTYYHGPQNARACVKTSVYKFYVCNDVPLEPIREALWMIPDTEITQSGEYNIEVMPKGINKGLGVKEFAAHLGIPMCQVMALGDENNDIPMLRHAALGIAMDNASDVVKSHANYITTHVDDNGIYNALRHFHII
jgi:Cof subfamily protein (haloacid dehalogenase superfamily)